MTEKRRAEIAAIMSDIRGLIDDVRATADAAEKIGVDTRPARASVDSYESVFDAYREALERDDESVLAKSADDRDDFHSSFIRYIRELSYTGGGEETIARHQAEIDSISRERIITDAQRENSR